MVEAQIQQLVHEQYPLIVRTAQGVDIEGAFFALDDDRGRLMVELKEDPPHLHTDESLTLFFTRNGQRWSMSTTLHHYPRPTSLVLHRPAQIHLADRRLEPRALLVSPTMRVSARTALFEGILFEGTLLSLSPQGLSFRVEHVEGPHGPLGNWRRELEPGRPLESLKIHGLPFDVEGEGRVLFLEEDQLGLRLRGLSTEMREWVLSYVESHAKQPPKQLELGPLLPLHAPATPAKEAPSRSQALLRLKKRGRTLVLAMKAGHLRDALKDQLVAWGYGRVEVMDTLAQWLEFIQTQLVDLVFIDGGLRELKGVELASFLHQARGERNYAILLAENLEGNSLGLIAKRAGVTHLLNKPYPLDHRLDAQLEGALDLRPLSTEEGATTPSVRHKRKAVALAMMPGPKRDALQAFLLGEGFCRVLPAGTVGELIQALQSPTLGLVFVDWEDTRISGLEVAAFLASQRGATQPQLVLVGDPGRMDVEARALGVARVLGRGYGLNSQLTEALMEALEALEAAS